MSDPQAAWDDEDTTAFQRRLRKASAEIKAVDAELAKQRQAHRAAKRNHKRALSELNAVIATAKGGKAFLARLRELDTQIQRYEEDVRRTRQLYVAATARRRLLLADRSVTIRRKFERFPLEEYAERIKENEK